MKLTLAAIKKARATDRPIKLFDGGGLYLLVKPEGGKLWRLKYRVNGKEKLLSFGAYPDVSLDEARDKRHDARKQLRAGIDPSAQKQAERQATTDTFKAIAEEWLKRQNTLAPDTIEQFRTRLETHLYPDLGDVPVREVDAAALLKALRVVEGKGLHETAHRARALAGRVMRYAVATGRADRDPSADLKGALTPVRGKHHAAVTDPKQVGDLIRALDGYSGRAATYCALRLAPLVFVRPGELRRAEWSEIDLDSGEWRIPAGRMKLKRAQHLVPLSRQAVVILREMHIVSGQGRLVFPSLLDSDRPMSNNTVNMALRRLGYTKDEMTGHGFRTIASTLLNERGFPPDVIERQLAHVEQNKVRAAYNRAERLDERKAMMQAWADCLDELKRDAEKRAKAAQP